MLPEYCFESRPNDRALATAGSVLTIGLSIKGWSHSKNQFGERKRLTNLEALAVVISKAWPDAGRVSFFSSSIKTTKGEFAGRVSAPFPQCLVCCPHEMRLAFGCL